MSSSANLVDLGPALAVAEEGNITRAAERLHISQPALSAAIKQLEAQLGVALLDRSDRVVRVTPSGALLADEGRGLLAAALRAVHVASRLLEDAYRQYLAVRSSRAGVRERR